MTRPVVVLLAPLGGSAGGVASWTAHLLASEVARDYDLRVLDVDPRDPRNRKARAAKAAAWAGHLADLGWRLAERPAIVHVNTSAKMPGFLKEAAALALARAGGARTVLHVHSVDLERVLGHPRLGGACRRLVGLADRVVVLGASAREKAVRRGVRGVVVLPNGVPLRPLPARAPHGGPLRVLYVGWIKRAKGVFDLLEALARVPDAELTVLGRWVDEPPERSEEAFRAACRRLGLEGRVHLAGEVPLQEVWDHYERADVFALPSHSEGLPLALLEAMMAGLPAVTTPVGAIPDVVTDGVDGLLVPPRAPAALARALRRLAGDPGLRERLGRAAHARAARDLTTAAATRGVGALYDELLGRAPAASPG